MRNDPGDAVLTSPPPHRVASAKSAPDQARRRAFAAVAVLMALIVVNERTYLIHPPFSQPVSFALGFVLFRVLAFLARARMRALLILLAFASLGLCAAEVAGIMTDRPPVRSFTKGLFDGNSVAGVGPGRAGVFHDEMVDPKTGQKIFSADYTVDSNLLRLTRSGEADPVIAFVGNSVTFGVGVDDRDTMPQQFADLIDPRQRVVNLASGAHGPAQFLRELQTGVYDSLIGPKPGAFIFLTEAWGAERTACLPYWTAAAPRYAIEGGAVVYKGRCANSFAFWPRQWIVNSPPYRAFIAPHRPRVDHDDIELYIRVLSAAVELARSKYGAPTVIPYLMSGPSYFEGTGFTDDMVIKRLEEAGAIVFDASLEKEAAAGAVLTFPIDGHPTALAHLLRAREIDAVIKQKLPDALLADAK